MTEAPALRDQFGQPWPWPPLAPLAPVPPRPGPGPGSVPEAGPSEPAVPGAGSREPAAPGASLPDAGRSPSRCWLFFLPGAFTPVCTAEIGWVDELAERLAPAGVGLCVVAPDSTAVLREFGAVHGVRTPLLSDFWPHGAAARAVDEFNETTGRPHRSSVLVDGRGSVLARIRAGAGQERRLRDHLDAAGVGRA